MKKLLVTIGVFSLLIFLTQCKEEESGEDWAAAVTGTYTGSGTRCGGNPLTSSTTIITRISDKMFNLQLSVQYGSSSTDSYCLDSVSMNSSTTFSVNEIEGCHTSKNATGGGNFNGNSLNYTISSGTFCELSLSINGSK